MKLTFWGADKVVTGSMHHIETGGKNGSDRLAGLGTDDEGTHAAGFESSVAVLPGEGQ